VLIVALVLLLRARKHFITCKTRFISTDRSLSLDLLSRSSHGHSLAPQQSCPGIALDYDRTSLCTWSCRNDTSARRARFV